MPIHNLGKNLVFLRKSKGIIQQEIQDQLGFKKNTWSNWENEISEPNLDNLVTISQFFDVSLSDLVKSDLSKGNLIPKNGLKENVQKGNLIGNPIGNLNKENELREPSFGYLVNPKNKVAPAVITVDSANRDNIVHVTVKGRAGYQLGYGDPEYIGTLPSYTLPGLKGGIFRSFEVEGNSMYPTIKNKEIIVGKWVDSLSEIREGRVHIIVTRNDGILIKRVLNRISERGKLYLKSDAVANRQEYPTIELDPSEVAEIWYACMHLGTDFSEPGEYFTRLNDLEIRMMEVMKRLEVK